MKIAGRLVSYSKLFRIGLSRHELPTHLTFVLLVRHFEKSPIPVLRRAE
jgi:hypothetical protein